VGALRPSPTEHGRDLRAVEVQFLGVLVRSGNRTGFERFTGPLDTGAANTALRNPNQRGTSRETALA
jgi:hypothetical protein